MSIRISWKSWGASQEVSVAGGDLVPVATIFSRPELICFVAALEAEGLHCCIVGNHYGNLTQELVAIGGYSVRVPEAQLDWAVDLIAELRLATAAIEAPRSLARRIWMLFLFLAALGCAPVYTMSVRDEVEMPLYWNFMGFLYPATYPFPIRITGDYRDQDGRMKQMR
jgi:hypothetical protein